MVKSTRCPICAMYYFGDFCEKCRIENSAGKTKKSEDDFFNLMDALFKQSDHKTHRSI